MSAKVVTTEAVAATEAIASAYRPPWYVRMTRWRPTSMQEGLDAEIRLLDTCNTKMEVHDVPCATGNAKPSLLASILCNGDSTQNFLHTLSGGRDWFAEGASHRRQALRSEESALIAQQLQQRGPNGSDEPQPQPQAVPPLHISASSPSSSSSSSVSGDASVSAMPLAGQEGPAGCRVAGCSFFSAMKSGLGLLLSRSESFRLLESENESRLLVGKLKDKPISAAVDGSSASKEPVVVFMPGYAAGSAFFFRNFAELSRRIPEIHAVDWLGTGLSGRPRFVAGSREETETFFLDSLAQWKEAVVGPERKMILVGHSLGGYLAARFALRHPDDVAHLVLICPAGVPEAPHNLVERLRKMTGSSAVFNVLRSAWEGGVTPGSIIRFLGPFAPSMMSKYVDRRFSAHGDGLPSAAIGALKDYMYHITAARGSGEFALRHLLQPGAFAHAPLERDLHLLEPPVTFLYGEQDWMRPEYAVKLCRKIHAERSGVDGDAAAAAAAAAVGGGDRRESSAAASASASGSGNGQGERHMDLKVELVSDSGHFVFMDQPALFNRAFLNIVAPYFASLRDQHQDLAPDASTISSADHVARMWTFADDDIVLQHPHDVRVPRGVDFAKANAAASNGNGNSNSNSNNYSDNDAREGQDADVNVDANASASFATSQPFTSQSKKPQIMQQQQQQQQNSQVRFMATAAAAAAAAVRKGEVAEVAVEDDEVVYARKNVRCVSIDDAAFETTP